MPYSPAHSPTASYLPHPAHACLMRFRTIHILPPMNSNTPSPTSIHTTSTLGNAKRAGRDGSQNFSVQDKMALLDAIEMVKPLGPAKWEQVLDAYNEYCIENGRASRDVAGIRRKFNSLVNFPKPTGDPTCPPEVKRAKEASRMITESVEFGGLDDMDDDDDSWDEQHDEHAEGLDDPNLSASSRHSSTRSEAPAAKRGASEVVTVSKKKNKANVNGVMDSLAAFLDVDKRDERERSSEVIAMYRQQIEHLRQDCRELRCKLDEKQQKLDEKQQKLDDERLFAARLDSQFQRERAELAAERDRALQKLLVYELMNGKS